MNFSTLIAVIMCGTVGSAFAQKEFLPLTYNKEKLDSLFQAFPKLSQPFTIPGPKYYRIPFNTQAGDNDSFDNTYPGATIINKTNRGTVYNVPTDNMAVLVPDMDKAERMPGSKRSFIPSPQGYIPNPKYPGNLPKRNQPD